MMSMSYAKGILINRKISIYGIPFEKGDVLNIHDITVNTVMLESPAFEIHILALMSYLARGDAYIIYKDNCMSKLTRQLKEMIDVYKTVCPPELDCYQFIVTLQSKSFDDIVTLTDKQGNFVNTSGRTTIDSTSLEVLFKLRYGEHYTATSINPVSLDMYGTNCKEFSRSLYEKMIDRMVFRNRG